jgi:phage-related protein
MAVTTDSLLVDISVDTKNASASIQNLNKQFADMMKVMKSTDASSKKTEESITGIGFAAVKLNAILGIAQTAWSALSSPVRSAVDEHAKAQRALNKVATSLKLVGQFTEEHVQSFADFADEMQNVANVSDDVTLSLVAQAKAGGLSDKMTKQLIKSAADLASVTDKDVNSAFRELMGQLSGTPGRIAKTIPELNKFTIAELQAGKGIEFLAERLKDFSTSDAKTLEGTMIGASLAFDDFKKAIGKAITETVNLPALFTAVKGVLRDLTQTVKDLTPKMEQIGSAFAAVDWMKVAQGVALLTASFIAFQGALKAAAIYQAIQAIGGLSSAVAAMGGLSGMIAQTVAWFSKLRVAATIAMVPMLKVAAIAGLILSVAAAVDILIRNFDKLGQLGTIVGQSLKVAFLTALQAVNFVITEMLGLIGMAGQKINDAFGKNIVNVESFNKSLEDGYRNANDLQGAIDKSTESIKKASVGIDFGFAGEGVKLVAGLMKDVEVGAKGAAAAGKGFADSTNLPVQNLEEMRKALDEIVDKNKTLFNDINNMGKTQNEQIYNTMQLELERVEIKRKQLALEGKLNSEISAGLDAQKELIQQRAGKQIEQNNNPNLVSPDQLAAIKSAFGEGAAGAASSIGSAAGALSGVMGGVGAVMGAVNGVLDFVQQLIDFVPQVLSKIANIFNSLTDLPNKIAEGIANVMDSVINFVENFIPNLLNSIPTILDELITGLFERLPEALEGLIAKLPDIIVAVVEKLPDLVERLVVGVITNAPRIAIALVEGVIRGAPKIAMAMIKLMVIELPKAIIKGIIEGGKRLIGMLTGLFSGIKMPKFDEKAITNAFKSAGKAFTNATSQMFNVSDLGDMGKIEGTEKVGEAIADKLEDLFKWLKDLWDKFIKGLKAIWSWIWDKILKPFIDFLKKAWDVIWKTLKAVWDGLVKTFKAAWDAAMNYFNSVINSLKAAWEFITRTFQGVINFFRNTFQTLIDMFSGKISFLDGVRQLWQNTFGAITGQLQNIANFFKSIFDNFSSALGGIVNTLKTAVDSLKNALSNFTSGIANVGGKIWESFKAGLSGGGKFFASIGDQIWGGLLSGLKSVKNVLSDQISGLAKSVTNLLSKMFKFDSGGRGAVEKVLGIDVPFVGFARGGVVPGTAAVPGDSEMNDRFLAMLSPGEAVIKRTHMQKPWIRKIIDDIQSGKMDVPRFAFGKGGDLNPFDDGGGWSNPFEGWDTAIGGAFSDAWEGMKGFAKSSLGPIAGQLAGFLNPEQFEGIGKWLDKQGKTISSANIGEMISDIDVDISWNDILQVQELADHWWKQTMKLGEDAIDLAVKTAKDPLAALRQLDPRELWKRAKAEGMKVASRSLGKNTPLNFHDGGLVQGIGEIPARLLPGEYVMNQNAVNRIGLSNLNAMNNGSGSNRPVEQVFNMNFKIETEQPIDENFFRNKLMPRVKEEFRRMSLDGNFVISTTGIRSK